MREDNKWKKYTWRHWLKLHWIINPGLAFNEIILGQRVPKVSLEDTDSKKPRHERSFVPCPHCNYLHDGRTWSEQNKTGFKNWFGLYCHNCGDVIPCLRNGLSFLILIITAPFWFLFKDKMKANWLAAQPARFKHLDLESIPNPYDGYGWVKEGLVWGLFMYVFMELIYYPSQNDSFETKKLLLGIPFWAIGGLCYGYGMKLLMGRRGKTKTSLGEQK